MILASRFTQISEDRKRRERTEIEDHRKAGGLRLRYSCRRKEKRPTEQRVCDRGREREAACVCAERERERGRQSPVLLSLLERF